MVGAEEEEKEAMVGGDRIVRPLEVSAACLVCSQSITLTGE